MATRTAYRICNICEATCGLRFELDGERIVKVTGDPDDPFSKGFLCPKGLAMADIHRDPDRLRRPLVRDANGKLQEAEWDEAFRRAGEGLSGIIGEYGRHALGLYLGNPTVHNLGAMVGNEIWRTLVPRTKNRYTANSQDANPHLLANYLMFGTQAAIPVPDLPRTNYLLIVGGNPMVSNGSLMTAPGIGRRLKEIQSRGGRVVVIDPRRTRTARVACEHLRIRPEADALLLLALAREIVATDGWDRAYLTDWTTGWERLEELLAPFTPEAVAPRLGPELDAATIRRLAHELVRADGAAVYGRVGICLSPYAGLAAWAVHLLNIITGNLDRPGGMMFPQPPLPQRFFKRLKGGYDRWRSPQGVPEIVGEYPCHILAQQMERGAEDPHAEQAIVGMLVVAGNPVLSAPGQHRLEEAFKGLKFMVSVDTYLSETARLADVVLPPASVLTDPHFDVVFQALSVENVARYSPALLPEQDGAPSEYHLLVRLAREVGRRLEPRSYRRPLGWLLQRVSPERWVDLLVRQSPNGAGWLPFSQGLSLRQLRKHPHGIPPTPLQPCLKERLLTEDGRIHLIPRVYEEDLPRLQEELTGNGNGLVLIGRRNLRTNNTWLHNVESMHHRTNRCTLMMHPDDAASMEIVDGATVRVRSRVAEVEATAQVTDEVLPGVVSLPHGWGHQEHGGQVARANPGVNVNALTDDRRFCPLTGNAALNGVPVEVEPVGVPAAPQPAARAG